MRDIQRFKLVHKEHNLNKTSSQASLVAECEIGTKKQSICSCSHTQTFMFLHEIHFILAVLPRETRLAPPKQTLKDVAILAFQPNHDIFLKYNLVKLRLLKVNQIV